MLSVFVIFLTLVRAAEDDFDALFDEIDGQLVQSAGGAEMTPDEKAAHRANFRRHCGEKGDACGERAAAVTTFLGAVPANNAQKLSQLQADAAAEGYEIGYNEGLVGMSTLDVFEKKLGIALPDGALERWTAETAEQPLEVSSGLLGSIPSRFDPREKWPHCADVIGAVRDQGSCGSCWAHGTTSAFNDRVCIATEGRVNQLFSTQHVTSCCTGAYSNNPSERGCSGGWPKAAWEMFESTGVVTGGDADHHGDGDTCWPYQSGSGRLVNCRSTCTENRYPIAFHQDKYKAKRGTFKTYRESSRASIQKDLMRNGPLSFCFKVCDSFNYYKSGVYDCNCHAQDCGHEMKLIGWGRENGKDYWLTINSWDTWWGDGGFVKFKFGTRCNLMLIEGSEVASDVDGGDGGYDGGGGADDEDTDDYETDDDEDGGGSGPLPAELELAYEDRPGECLRDPRWGSTLRTGSSGCTTFRTSGHEHMFSIKYGNNCLDYFRNDQALGIYDCHGGENQKFKRVGSKYCLSVEYTNDVCVRAFGEAPTPDPTPPPTEKKTKPPTPKPTPASSEPVCRRWCGDHDWSWTGAAGKCTWRRCSGCSRCAS